jgi:uncharacterized protein with PIN domain
MAGLYLDTSALGRVLLGEPDAETIRDTLAGYDTWWASALLAVELRRLARREGLEALADRMLANVRLTDVDKASLDRASRLDPVEVATLDAIHLDASRRTRPPQNGHRGPDIRPAAPDGMLPSRAGRRGAGRPLRSPSR